MCNVWESCVFFLHCKYCTISNHTYCTNVVPRIPGQNIKNQNVRQNLNVGSSYTLISVHYTFTLEACPKDLSSSTPELKIHIMDYGIWPENGLYFICTHTLYVAMESIFHLAPRLIWHMASIFLMCPRKIWLWFTHISYVFRIFSKLSQLCWKKSAIVFMC